MCIGQTTAPRRGGFSLIEMLAVIVVLTIISVALTGVFTTVITDIPRSYRVIQTNTTVLNMLERMRQDINAARGLWTEDRGQKTENRRQNLTSDISNDGLLLIEMSDGVISYQVEDDKVLRCSLSGLRQGLRPDETAADDSKVSARPRSPRGEAEGPDGKDTMVWSVPYAKVKWQVWRENGKGYAVQVETYIEHKVRGRWEKKMANSHLYFVGQTRLPRESVGQASARRVGAVQGALP